MLNNAIVAHLAKRWDAIDNVEDECRTGLEQVRVRRHLRNGDGRDARVLVVRVGRLELEIALTLRSVRSRALVDLGVTHHVHSVRGEPRADDHDLAGQLVLILC